MPIAPERLKQIYITKGKIRADVSYVMWDLCSKCTGTTMPIPERDESKDDFINRCMNNREMKIKYSDETSRLVAGKFLWTIRADICKLSERCQYVKKGFCSVESQYLSAITAPVLKLLDESSAARLTELDWQDFGLKMIPLYHDLIKVKKAEAALCSVIVYSSHGVRMHPLYREKRDIIKAIDSLDISKLLKEKFRELGMKDVTPAGAGPDVGELLEQHGDPDFADSLMDSGKKGDGNEV